MIQTLDLSYNDIGPEGAEHIAKGLQVSHKILLKASRTCYNALHFTSDSDQEISPPPFC